MTKPALERAARALCELAGNPPMATMEGKPLWQSYLPEARAVLSAVREPTRAMVSAAERQPLMLVEIDVWHAMIDAALSEVQ